MPVQNSVKQLQTGVTLLPKHFKIKLNHSN